MQRIGYCKIVFQKKKWDGFLPARNEYAARGSCGFFHAEKIGNGTFTHKESEHTLEPSWRGSQAVIVNDSVALN